MIADWLKTYQVTTKEEARSALREIMQEVALTGLYRSGFFEKAAFYGGTALRIFHGLPRFSEDLDFSLLEKNAEFSLDPFMKAILLEFESLGMKVSVRSKEKAKVSAIESAFLKSETLWNEFSLDEILLFNRSEEPINLKIKLEVDTQPPLGFYTEEKLLLKPISCYIKCFSLADLFAGKMHALLFRKWKNRVKGRDWFDLEWYIKQGIPVHLNDFMTRAIQSKDWDSKDEMSHEILLELVTKKIQTVSFSQIKDDVKRFIPHQDALNIWSEKYFLDLIKQLKVT